MAGTSWFRTGYYTSGDFTATTTSVSPTVDVLLARPFLCPVRQSFDRVGFNVTSGGSAGAVLRCGIYGNDAGEPGTLISEFGTVSTVTSGSKEITISLTLDPGVYWLAGVCQTTNCTASGAGTFFSPFASASTTTSLVTTQRAALSTSGVTGALPTTATWASATLTPIILLLRAA